MFFSFDLIKNAYNGLVKLDESEGKSRKEKVSGLRHLMATSQLLHQENIDDIDVSVGSDLRQQFIDAVGNVVALNDQGLYTKDFSKEFNSAGDYSVGSNFLTTTIERSRHKNINYPGRPAHLLFLEQEHISIIENVGRTLSASFGVDNIKAELCVWLLRNESFTVDQEVINADELLILIREKLSERYTSEIVLSIHPTEDEIEALITDINTAYFVSEKPDLSDISNIGVTSNDEITPSVVRAFTNDLPDEDAVFQAVQNLLARGAKGILFSGPPGTSKTWYALKVALKIIEGDESKLERIQFHPSFTYEDFIEGLVSTGSISGTEPLFKPKSKVFLNLCDIAREDADNPYILIIDEFSRGDPSKIFGELLTYIEPDYREINFRLPYSERETSIPQNVIIFATMNPYDKSVVDLDSAMERRLDIVELLPEVNILTMLLQKSGVEGEIMSKVVNFFNVVNRLSPHGFGHTYFKNMNEEIDFILLWNHKLKFILKRMFHFKEDAYTEVRGAYMGIISEANQDKIS